MSSREKVRKTSHKHAPASAGRDNKRFVGWEAHYYFMRGATGGQEFLVALAQRALTASEVLDGCPMLASAYMGRKRCSSNAFTSFRTAPSGTVSRAPSESVRRGFAPSFSSHVRQCERGAPVRGALRDSLEGEAQSQLYLPRRVRIGCRISSEAGSIGKGTIRLPCRLSRTCRSAGAGGSARAL
jgi:hypothetical protein